MNLNFLQSIIMGFVSGLTQVLPVSAQAHRTILRTLFGAASEDVFSRLLIHIACIIALAVYFRQDITKLRLARELMKIPPKRRRRTLDSGDAGMVKLLRSATIILVICKLFTPWLDFIGSRLNYLPASLAVSGCLLMIPALTRSGNMNSRNMPRMYGFLMGFGAGMSVVPGISQVGASMSLGQWRGADRHFALKFACLLLIPGLGCHIAFDLIQIVMGGAAVFSGISVLWSLLGAIAAGIGCYCAVKIMYVLAEWTGFSCFAYYNWGAALLCFVLFLML